MRWMCTVATVFPLKTGEFMQSGMAPEQRKGEQGGVVMLLGIKQNPVTAKRSEI